MEINAKYLMNNLRKHIKDIYNTYYKKEKY